MLVDQRLAQIMFKAHALGDDRIHLGFKKPIAVAPGRLGGVQGRIGIFQQRIDIVAICRIQADPNARCQVNFMTIEQ